MSLKKSARARTLLETLVQLAQGSTAKERVSRYKRESAGTVIVGCVSCDVPIRVDTLFWPKEGVASYDVYHGEDCGEYLGTAVCKDSTNVILWCKANVDSDWFFDILLSLERRNVDLKDAMMC